MRIERAGINIISSRQVMEQLDKVEYICPAAPVEIRTWPCKSPSTKNLDHFHKVENIELPVPVHITSYPAGENRPQGHGLSLGNSDQPGKFERLPVSPDTLHFEKHRYAVYRGCGKGTENRLKNLRFSGQPLGRITVYHQHPIFRFRGIK